ncbi:MAG: hypothetical protein H6969_11455 [Gammaproteobacteria bacterium]|nr:hypothetical protein [Gammaproteobacteria bacterium]
MNRQLISIVGSVIAIFLANLGWNMALPWLVEKGLMSQPVPSLPSGRSERTQESQGDSTTPPTAGESSNQTDNSASSTEDKVASDTMPLPSIRLISPDLYRNPPPQTATDLDTPDQELPESETEVPLANETQPLLALIPKEPPTVLPQATQPAFSPRVELGEPWIEYGPKGMSIHIRGRVVHGAGKPLRIVVRYFDETDHPLLANPMETQYVDTAGNVVTYNQALRVDGQVLQLDGLPPLILPYYAFNLNLPPNTRRMYLLSLVASVYLDGEPVANSLPVRFRLFSDGQTGHIDVRIGWNG